MNKKTRIYRKDYQPSSYLIKTTKLVFEIKETQTIVKAELSFYKNPKSRSSVSSLFLNGEGLELIDIKIDGKKTDYELKDDGLVLNNLSDEFILKTKVKIYPHKNTTLNGLYKSNSIFCTQCEAHGFRNITYYLDRPDILSTWEVGIFADFSTILSNGNLKNKSKYYAKWIDPFPKPCYLFALVVGNLAVNTDKFITKSGKKVELEIFTEFHNKHKTDFAIKALKNAMKWDESRFGLEYDLDNYKIVAVDDFNMGAMENKGLNIFNSTYVLADENTATDEDFLAVEAVIGHEYFHNWTGNRVTCRDWFQLSLKEGLTVFRDQEFTSDLHSRSIKRIDDVDGLRTFQFSEDRGPMKHSVRPESYIEMNNFYTSTVYEKGSEIIRMMHTFLGEDGFQKGMRLYFERFDGEAVSIDDFVCAMSDANDFDFDKFMTWYSNAGTPKVVIKNDNNKITISKDDDRLIPLKYGVLDKNGIELENGLLTLDNEKNTFDFTHLPSDCVFSYLRDFSAPIELKTDLTTEQKIHLVAFDNNAFNRWDNVQKLWLMLILTPDKIDQKLFFNAVENILLTTKDNALISEMLTLPAEKFIHNQVKQIDVFAIRKKREKIIAEIIKHFKPLFKSIYSKLNTGEKHNLTPKAVGNRALKNICLYYLVKGGEFELAYKQFNTANCMSDKFRSFNFLVITDNPYKNKAIDKFFKDYKQDAQVMDKWFAAQAISPITTVNEIKKLMEHKLFLFNNPNRLRSVVGSFSANYCMFHKKESYEFFTNIIIKLNKTNPQIGARLTSVYNHWRRFTPDLKALQKRQLEKILITKNLSNDIFEIADAALKQDC